MMQLTGRRPHYRAGEKEYRCSENPDWIALSGTGVTPGS
jgi:hypothetical protein